MLTLAAEGRYAFDNRGRTVAGGILQVDGERLAFTDTTGIAACRDGVGRYTWRYAADTLQFTVVDDRCAGRRAQLLAAPWVRARAALALVHATVFDGTGTPPRRGMTVVLREGRIAALFPDGAEAVPEDAQVRDLSGSFVMPGLVDAHVHLATRPSDTDRRDRIERRLRAALLGGVVAVRDMAGDARALADLARAAAAGDIAAPDIRYAALVAGPGFFDDPRALSSSAGLAPGTAPWARAIADTSDLRQVIAEARGTGAAAIKLYGALDGRLAASVAGEARRQGLLVWSHLALFPARPSEVVAAGVGGVSHANLVLWEAEATLPGPDRRQQVNLDVSPEHPAIQRLFARMRERGVILDPTLFVFRADSSLPDTSRARRLFARAVELTRAAHRAGVRIAAGTDAMIREEDGALPNLHDELALLVEHAGLSPVDALVAGTRTAAELAGLGATHGTIAPGKAADLLVLRADPTVDIRNTRQVLTVLRRGQPVDR